MADYAESYAEKQLAQLERKINRIYSQAYNEIGVTINNYFYGYEEVVNGKVIYHQGFYERDEEMRDQLAAGKIDETYYKQWRLNNIGRGQRFEAVRDQIAERMTDANATAVRYMNDTSAQIYTEARNFAAYTIEQTGASIKFDLLPENAVREALKEGYRTMPYYDETFPMAAKNHLTNKDIQWGQKQITNTVTSDIIQGKSIKQMADDLQSRITTMSRTSALRAARTASGAAYNAGHQAAYSKADKMGIKGKKQWSAHLDKRVRDSHRHLDGVEVEVNEEFPNGLLFPRDPNGEPAEVYNCRCRIIYVIPEIADDFKSENTVETYNQWKAEKAQQKSITKVEVEEKKPDISSINLTSDVGKRLLTAKIEYNEPDYLGGSMTHEQIVSKLCGGDKTGGSCSSLAFAYAANYNGLDVTDYRGGRSRDFFSRNSNIYAIADLPGVKSVFAESKNDFTGAHQVLKNVESGKKYYFATGKHASIVFKDENGILKYTEMQSPHSNGSFPLTDRILKYRFGCQKSHSSYGMTFSMKSVLVDVSSFADCEEFPKIMGYINTDPSKQMKGETGSVR